MIIANPFAKPLIELQALVGHVVTVTKLLSEYPGRTFLQWPQDAREFLVVVCEQIVRAMREDAQLADLAVQAVYLDPARSPCHFAQACKLPEHAEELTLLATGATLLLHLDAHGEAAARRPVSASTVQRAICLADWQRARFTPPPKLPAPPVLPDYTEAVASTPQVPAATVLAKMPAPQSATGPETDSTLVTAVSIVDEGSADEPPAAYVDANTNPPQVGSPDAVQWLLAIVERHQAGHPDQPLTLRALKRNHGFDAATVRSLAAAHPQLFTVAALPVGSQGGRPSEVLQCQNP